MKARTLSIVLAALTVLAAGAIYACVSPTEGTTAGITVDDHLPHPGLDAGGLIEPPELRGDFDIQTGVALPFDLVGVEVPPETFEQTVAVETDFEPFALDTAYLPPAEPEACGERVCGATEACCPAYGICVPNDCYDCCDRLARGEHLEEAPEVPGFDPWPGAP